MLNLLFQFKYVIKIGEYLQNDLRSSLRMFIRGLRLTIINCKNKNILNLVLIWHSWCLATKRKYKVINLQSKVNWRWYVNTIQSIHVKEIDLINWKRIALLKCTSHLVYVMRWIVFLFNVILDSDHFLHLFNCMIWRIHHSKWFQVLW